MKQKWIIFMVFISILLLFLPCEIFANDLDDGISQYRDENIQEEDKLGKLDTNINFIIVSAIASAKTKKEKSSPNKKNSFGGEEEELNENSVIVEAGAQTGDIINIVMPK